MKPRSVLIGLAVLIGVQLVLLVAYFAVQSWRSQSSGASFPVERVDEAAPPLVVERLGRPVTLPEAPHLVHFWATWCAPCLTELPSLLQASEQEGVPLLAVTEEAWPLVDRHFDGEVPDAIVRDPVGAADTAWRVSGLPDTFVVDQGRVTARMGGARDWSSPAARSFLRDLRRRP